MSTSARPWSWSAAAPASPAIRSCSRRWRGAELERAISASKSTGASSSTAQGRVIAERPLRQILTSWDRLQSLLRETISPGRYHLGRTFERVDQDGSEVRVRFADGARPSAPTCWSAATASGPACATQVAPQVQPVYAGYYIWRGAPNEADLAPATRAGIFPHFTFFLPEREQVIGYPIAGLDNDLRPGHRRYNFIWYRVGDARQLAEMCVDENGRRHAFSVPPPLIRKDLIARMRADAAKIMPPAFLDALGKIERPFFTPIYDFAAPRLVFGRVALVGDAAATARPHMGFGVAKAGGDAWALAEALRDCHGHRRGARPLRCRAPADGRAHRAARPQARHVSRRRPETEEDRRMSRAAVAASRPDGLDRGARISLAPE